MQNMQNPQKKLGHVLCSASNCAFNDPDSNSCTAAHIDVGGQVACCSGETCCKTFIMNA